MLIIPVFSIPVSIPGLCSPQCVAFWHLKMSSPGPARQAHQELLSPSRKISKVKDIVKPVEELVKRWG